MTSTALTPEQIVARNMATVDAHFHNGNPRDIDKAIDLYGDSIVWEVPARGLLLRDKAAVKAAYLKMFESLNIHSITPIRRFAADNWVVDDTAGEGTLVGDVETNVPGCPLPTGTRVNLRIVHLFELDDDGRITRENAYELWRRADGPIDDDIPPTPPPSSSIERLIVAPSSSPSACPLHARWHGLRRSAAGTNGQGE